MIVSAKGFRSALFFLLLLSVSLALPFGRSEVKLERVWTIHGEPGSRIDFDGALAINDSNQRIISITTDPQMDQAISDDGSIRLRYQGDMEGDTMLLKGTAIIDVDYDTNLTSDPALASAPRNFTDSNLTEPDQAISAEARSLSDSRSSLGTIRDIVDWIHKGMTYDISYWGKVVPAKDVFRDRRRVCVEYTHLLISMAHSLGLQTRYVSGYVYGTSWQPHAWADIEIPGYGWLPVDATFDQVGILDSSHMAVSTGADQSSAYDLLLSDKAGASLGVDDSIDVRSQSADQKGVSITLAFDNATYVVSSEMNNSRPEFVYGSYEVAGQDHFLNADHTILLLPPSKKMTRYYGINSSLFQEGFIYTIPLTASFNDAQAALDIRIATPSPQTKEESGEAPQCLLPLILLAIALLSVALPKALVEVTYKRKAHISRFLKQSLQQKVHGRRQGPRGRRRS